MTFKSFDVETGDYDRCQVRQVIMISSLRREGSIIAEFIKVKSNEVRLSIRDQYCVHSII